MNNKSDVRESFSDSAICLVLLSSNLPNTNWFSVQISELQK